MPDLSSLQTENADPPPPRPPSSESATPSIPVPTGGGHKFSYTKNWGEVSDTLRKKLSKRLSVLKESDDNSGDEDRAYRSDRSHVEGSRSPPDSLLSGHGGSPHERSPDALLGADGLSSVRHSRAAIWQKISSASAAQGPPPSRFNRVGTTFQGLYVAPTGPHASRTRGDDDGTRSPRTGSGTPDREYRSLAAFITRSATPERLRARANTPGGGGVSRSNTPGGGGVSRSNTPAAGRSSRAETPERRASTETSPRAGSRGRQSRMSVRRQRDEGEPTRSSAPSRNGSHGPNGDGKSLENKRAFGDDELHSKSIEEEDIVRNQKHSKHTNGNDFTEPETVPESLEDDDDDNCLACKSESQKQDPDSAASEMNSPRSMRSGKSNQLSTDGGLRESPDDYRSSHSSSVSHRESSKTNIEESEDDRSTSRTSRTVTHFVEVTSMEDGNKRITYVENGITVEPVVVSKTKGSYNKKTRTKTPAPKAIQEDGSKREKRHIDSESLHSAQSSRSSKSKQNQLLSSPEPSNVSHGSSPNSYPEVSELPDSPSSSEADAKSSANKEWPLEPGPHTGAIPKRRDRFGTRVVKFPKDRPRELSGESPPTETQEDHASQPRDIHGHRNSSSVQNGSVKGSGIESAGKKEEVSPARGPESAQSWTAEAEIQRGSVAKRQALYESISEVNAARRNLPETKPELPPTPPARPAVMHPAPAAAPAPDATQAAVSAPASADTSNVTSAESAPAGSVTSEETANGTASSVAGSDTNGSERNYRLRRSALEALPVRVPSVRELVSSRFVEPPVSDLEHGNAEEPDAWIAEPLDEERQGAESDGDSSNHSQDSANHSQGSGSAVDDGKHSLLQFAMTNFRGAEERYNLVKDEDGAHSKMLETKNKKNKKKGKEDWTWREQVELVKWTDRPLRVSLLKLSPPELTRLAVESFSAIQRYMGDQTLPREVTDVDCVYTVLMACHRYPALRDEVYCQLMRQTTSNRSSQADSCARGWRLLSLVAAFFPCSESLRPYLQKYLETTAQDPRRAHRGTAAVSLQNLRQTLRLGGRRNVPSEEEIAAVTAGCTARRQRYLLPGGTQRIVNTRCTTVVQNVLVELCRELGVTTEDELEEFSLYCVVEGDAFTLPLARHEYVLDVTTELERNEQMFHLVLCRTVWSLPLRLDSAPYLDVLFSQVTPDYLEGLLLVLPAETLPQSVVFDIARVAALLHRSAGLRSMPTIKETKHLLPKAALLVRDIKPPQWVNMVQDSWSEVQDKTPAEARRAVLETLRGWPLFGSAFFVVGAAPESRGEAATDRLLAVNSSGLHLLDTVTHETQSQYPFSEVLSTRRVRSDAGDLYIDVKVGTPKQAKVIRMQTENAAEIARLIRQYSAAQQRSGPMAERAAEPRERQVSR
ncbi:serine/arginine repetitive matrix protein 2-like isoform X1 [Amphibalanus amphitrite]|uniref:serine/arginine repetitive matrix protein 2-like isoform X1 n=1 Tax=Amphibalanus amphitrite TaxID=1232801 RepID=UPI001C9121A5|nr:serine/arginine repetitive matrix protein 2-like isoform X1 [Amphibalanus amphitrite]